MMSGLMLADIARELRVDYRGPDALVNRVGTDSRQIGRDDLFVALRGERHDGHEFIADVAARGAIAAVVEAAIDCALPQLVVPDTRLAYGLIARLNRRRFRHPVVAITGSAGKTTCKEMVAAILAQCGETLATVGNLNNEIGVPHTLLRLAESQRYATIEMGAGRAGDIAYLCRFVEPDIGIVTSALPAHLEGFGDLDTIAKTKGELFSCLRGDGVAVINGDDPIYSPLWRSQAGERRIVTFGLQPDNDVTAHDVAVRDGAQHFTLVTPNGQVEAHIALLGLHNLRNALAASAAALAAGASLAAVQAGLATLKTVPGRLQSRPGLRGGAVIDDSYNANPGAVKAAIDVLAAFTGERLLILGNMAELGPSASRLHREVAAYAAQAGIEGLWCVGPWAQAMVAEFGADRARAFEDNDALIAALSARPPAAVTLVKGSRSARMETVVAALCGDKAEGAH